MKIYLKQKEIKALQKAGEQCLEENIIDIKTAGYKEVENILK